MGRQPSRWTAGRRTPLVSRRNRLLPAPVVTAQQRRRLLVVGSSREARARVRREVAGPRLPSALDGLQTFLEKNAVGPASQKAYELYMDEIL
eukprot:115347-Lingulodinium_polyedra.AAC.1